MIAAFFILFAVLFMFLSGSIRNFFNMIKQVNNHYEIGFSVMDNHMMGGSKFSLSYPSSMTFEDMTDLYVKHLRDTILTDADGQFVISHGIDANDVDDLYMLDQKISHLWVRISIKDISNGGSISNKCCIQYYLNDSAENEKKQYKLLIMQKVAEVMDLINPAVV